MELRVSALVLIIIVNVFTTNAFETNTIIIIKTVRSKN